MKRIRIILTAAVIAAAVFALPCYATYTEEIAALTYGEYSIPAYDGDPYEEVNGGTPVFSEDELESEPYEKYGKLDSLGRCTVCEGVLDRSMMPSADRGSIAEITPTGWVQCEYDESVVDNGYLYNRCHLIGYQLTGVDCDGDKSSYAGRDLITGTRYFNVEGMLVFENEVASYIRSSGNSVAYRVTPVFRGDNLLCDGVIMEAESIEDEGEGVSFCVFCYNVQPGIAIDYATGNSRPGAGYDLSKTIKLEKVTLSCSKYVYTGNARKPYINVYADGEKLKWNTNYSATFENNRKVGTAKVTVSGKGKYTGKITRTYRIVPKGTYFTSYTAGSHKAVLKWAKQSVQTDGYQLRYSTSSSFKTYKTITISRNTTVKRTVKNLKSKRKYYFKVRTYKTVSGEKYYSDWSKTRYVRVR